MSTGKSGLRLGRVLAYGIVAEVAVIALIVITLTVHDKFFAAGQPQSVIDSFAQRAPATIGPLAGILFTFLAALYCTRPLENRQRTHGVLVATVSSLLTLPGLAMATADMRPLYLAAILLKLIAGLAGGAVSERRYQSSISPPPALLS